jgi:hypothetical protein
LYAPTAFLIFRALSADQFGANMRIKKVEAFPCGCRAIGTRLGMAGSPNELAAGKGDYRWSDYPALY